MSSFAERLGKLTVEQAQELNEAVCRFYEYEATRRMNDRIEDLDQKLSAMEEYLGVEWYDVPRRERYVRKEQDETKK